MSRCAAVYYDDPRYRHKAASLYDAARKTTVSLELRAQSHRLVSIAVLLVGSVLLLGELRAHDIPASVLVQTHLKPQGKELTLLVRVPLEAMRDVVIPTRGPGYLALGEIDEVLHDAATIWVLNEFDILQGGTPLTGGRIITTRISLPSDRSFQAFDSAYAQVTGAQLPVSTDLMREQALLDILIRYPIADATTEFSVNPGFRRLGQQTTTVLHFYPVGKSARVFEFSGDPGIVRLDPRWHHAFFRFVRLGFTHILDGIDHILFVICLLIPFRRIRPLIALVTSFTVAHSITLIASAFGLAPKTLWFPPLIETLIAASIVYMAFENIVGSRWERRWVIAFFFGLVHGFGFSFALSETLQFAGSHLITSLLAFNVGVEIGQLVVVVIAVPLLNALFRTGLSERMGTILLSAILAHSGWHWMSERAAALGEYQFAWPALNLSFLASLMRWLMLFLIIAGTLWLLHGLYQRFVHSTVSAGNEAGR